MILSGPPVIISPARTVREASLQLRPKFARSRNLSPRLELMQQDGVALAVQAHRHSAHGTMDDVALEDDPFVLEVGHEAIEIFDLERDRATGGVAGLFLGKIRECQAAATRQIVFHPPVIASATR